MYFYPGKQKTFSRVFNKTRAKAFFDRQGDLFSGFDSAFFASRNSGGFKSGSYVTPGQSPMGGTIAQNLSNQIGVNLD